MKELLQKEINAWISANRGIGICLKLDQTSIEDLQTILTTIIKIRCAGEGEDDYDEYKYEVSITKIVSEDSNCDLHI